MLVNGKQQCLCWQLSNVMFLYIILHMAVKLSRHQCQCFAFSYHNRQREIIVYKCIPYPCMSKAGRKGMAGMVMTIPIFVYSTGLHSHTSKGLGISMHAATL